MASGSCPMCGGGLQSAGQVKAGPRGGLRDVVQCEECDYRALKQ